MVYCPLGHVKCIRSGIVVACCNSPPALNAILLAKVYSSPDDASFHIKWEMASKLASLTFFLHLNEPWREAQYKLSVCANYISAALRTTTTVHLQFTQKCENSASKHATRIQHRFMSFSWCKNRI